LGVVFSSMALKELDGSLRVEILYESNKTKIGSLNHNLELFGPKP
jgi:hypothetical protein